MSRKREITREDILPLEVYTARRKELKRAVLEKKKHRRLDIGPVCSFYFENYDTMWLQIQEMLYIEKGGEAQLTDELAAYNPLVPKGRELVATVMFEIDDEPRRKALLSQLGGVEGSAFFKLGEEVVMGRPEEDVDRTNAAGKASSVQFIHFPFAGAQIEAFRRPGAEVMLGFKHPAYSHMTVLPEAVRAALAVDFD